MGSKSGIFGRSMGVPVYDIFINCFYANLRGGSVLRVDSVEWIVGDF